MLYSYYEKTSDLSGDSENDYLFKEVDIIGSSGSTNSSDSSDRTVDRAEQAVRTLDNLSGISNIPTSKSETVLNGHAQKGA